MCCSELDLATPTEDEPKRDHSQLGDMNAINGRYGKGTVHAASTGKFGPLRAWAMKQERRMPQYTTRLEDVLVARA